MASPTAGDADAPLAREGDTMNEHAGLTGDEASVAGPGPAGRQRWRTILAVLLIVVGCVLAPLAGVAVWARNQVTNTDRYVRTVAPLASDPAIQTAIADQIFTYLDVQGLTDQTVDALAERGLPPRLADQLQGFAGPLASGIQGFVRTEVGKIVQSQAFAEAWVQAIGVAHLPLDKALTGEGDGAVTVEGDTVNLNLAPFIETVKQRLVEGGFGLAARIPEVNASFVLFDVKNLTHAQAAFDLLNTLGIWLPIIAIILLGLGVLVAKDHRRALVGAGLGVAGGILLLALGLAVFRTIYLDAVPAAVLPHDAAAVLYDTLVAYLRLGAAHRAGAWAGGGRRGVCDRHVRHGGAHPPELGARRRVAAGRRRVGGTAHRPGGDLGVHQQAGAAHRRRRPGQPGIGVLGPTDRQDHPGVGRAAAGGAGPDRVPRTATRTHRRDLHPNVNQIAKIGADHLMSITRPRATVSGYAVADGSGEGFATAGPTVRLSREGKQDDRGLCRWSDTTAGREANMTEAAPLGRQRWAEPEQLDDRRRLPPDDATTPGRPASATPAGAAPSTPARSGDRR
jgi:hypothetical protein